MFYQLAQAGADDRFRKLSLKFLHPLQRQTAGEEIYQHLGLPRRMGQLAELIIVKILAGGGIQAKPHKENCSPDAGLSEFPQLHKVDVEDWFVA